MSFAMPEIFVRGTYQVARYKGLVLVVLAAVSVRAIHHNLLRQFALGELPSDLINVLLLEIWASLPTTQNDVAQVVALGVSDGRQPLLGDT